MKISKFTLVSTLISLSALTTNAFADDSLSLDDKGEWEIQKNKSPIDDSENIHLYIYAETPIKGMFGKVIQPTLSFVCRENKTDAFITWDTYLGMDSSSMITRIDSKKAVTREVYISTDNKAAFFQTPVSIIKEMSNSQKLYAQIIPYGESPVATTFNLKGLSEAVKPLRQACKW
ncbi:type VI secretion system-associated protein TagO [Xenorhabdus bovienii]|uniref:type VI secretion system-associated protein TagO n=1 Tax=Xenorhabdus bovienii TaxID=40576 RepID=UPI00237C69CE|nr:type VI secretion system-associated protein TagO [Xenorhabdus bovienii]MDE1492738.1 type VI secretion protein [Xenorhabdus bovienii]